MRSLATDPFFIALMTGGNAHIISQPPAPRPQAEIPPPPKWKPWKADIDWEKTLPENERP